jgi:hypothetical protein
MDREAAVKRQVFDMVAQLVDDWLWFQLDNQFQHQVCERVWNQVWGPLWLQLRRRGYMEVHDQAVEDTDGSKSS